MSRNLTNKVNREIKYSNRDFGELRKALINHAKNYFPNTYRDFNETSPGMMFIEMASYVGDVLSFYSDIQLQESFLYTVKEKINLYNLSQGLGYKPKTIVPAQVDLNIMQLIPSIGEGTETRPDWNYALIISDGAQVYTDEGVYFRTVESVDFRFSSSYNPTTVSVYSETPDGAIEYYLLTKVVKAVAGELKTETFEFDDAKIYDKIVLAEENISFITSITDSDNETWYEVPYLAQDLVPIPVRNIPYNDPELAQYRSAVPYLLTYKQTEKRFITRLRKDDKTEIQFGAGLSQEADEEIVPNPYNIAIGLDYFRRAEDVSIDPMNFLYTKTYGRAPSDTTLTVKYAIANGLSDNVKANTIVNIGEIDIINPFEASDPTALDAVRDSITVNNPDPAYGGMNKRPLDVIREEAMANFAAQNRAVTKEDYILRCFTMPGQFGAIAKAYVEQDTQLSQWSDVDKIPNKYSLNLYILSFDDNKNVIPCNRAIKENLRQYLSQYRLMTDAVNIKDPFIINIGVDFEIITRPSYNSHEVSMRAVARMKELLSSDNIEIAQPLFVNKLYTEIDKIDGVQTVVNIKIKNLYDTNLGYSGNIYDVDLALRDGIIYPSMDASIFSVKYPNSDIRCSIIDL